MANRGGKKPAAAGFFLAAAVLNPLEYAAIYFILYDETPT